MTGSGFVSVLALTLNAMAIVVAWWANEREVLIGLLAAAATNGTTTVNFWLGSSAGSRAKDEIIARNAPGQ